MHPQVGDLWVSGRKGRHEGEPGDGHKGATGHCLLKPSPNLTLPLNICHWRAAIVGGFGGRAVTQG